MRLSDSNLELLRTRPQQTKLYLSIFQPTAIFQARVNNPSASSGDRVIPFDTVSLGNSTLVQNGMTMWVGNTLGGQEVGKVRVKSITPSAITVSENDNIDWQDNQYLTVYKYWELWPIFPRIIINPSNPEDVIFYKDYDEVYTDQNSILGTFVNAGPHRAAWLDPASGQTQLFWSSTGSYNLVGTSLAYNWQFEGGTPSTSTAADPGLVTYNTPGHYVTRLSISGSNGCVDTTYRYTSIYNQANPPIQKWKLNSFQGSRDEGGHTASFTVHQTIPLQEHAVVVLFGENWYGNTKQSLGGNYPNGSDIFFAGYIDKDSIEYDYEHSEVSFDAVSITNIMSKTSGFSVSVKSVANPAKWYELLDMDSRRALYHYLKWHTTAMNIADFQFVGDDYKIQFFDSDRESMYDAINNYMNNTLIGQTVSDRQGKVWLETQAMAYSNPTGSFSPPVMDITNRDWMNKPTITERLTNDVSYMEYGGVAYSGVVTGTFNVFIGSAPGNAPGFYGGIDNHQGMALLGQNQINQLVGNVFANKNSPFPAISVEMGINATNLDIAPQEGVGLHLTREDTVRNLAINTLNIPDSISWKYDPDNFNMLPQIDFKQIVNGKAGETVIIPAVSEVGGGFSVPRLETPPLPVIFAGTTPDVGDGSPARVLIHDTTAGLLYTQTFNTASPGWYQVNGGLTLTQYRAINRVVICPNGAIYAGNTRKGVDTFLARAPFIGGVFTIIEDATSIAAKFGSSTDTRVAAFNCNPLSAESVAYVITVGGSGGKGFIGAGSTFAAGFSSAFSTIGEASISFGLGKWLLTYGYFRTVSADMVTLAPEITPTTSNTLRHIRVVSTENTLHWNANDFTIGEDNCATLIEQIGTSSGIPSNLYLEEDSVACDYTGSVVMAQGANNGLKSTDGAYSWSPIGNLISTQRYWFGNVPTDSAKWVAVSQGGYIFYTENMWNTYPIDKRGNLHTINPLPHLDVVKVLS